MYSYVKGVVTIIEPSYIVVEAYGIGYMIYVSNPYSYKQNEEVLVYLYQQVREDENTLYGFKTKDEKDLFLKLISVKGLGPKMALPMLTGDISYLLGAIEDGNISYLKKFPKIGDKVARQIILDLKGKLASKNDLNLSGDFDELVSVLESLGYKNAEIKKVLPKVNASLEIEDQIKEALKLMLK